MKSLILALLTIVFLFGSAPCEETKSTIFRDNQIVQENDFAAQDTFVATYDRPLRCPVDSSALTLPPSDTAFQKRIQTPTPDSGLSELVPNKIYFGEVISYQGGGDIEPCAKSEISDEAQGEGGAPYFMEVDANNSRDSIDSNLENPPRDERSTEIPMAERFLTRSLDRNTAVMFLYIDGGGPTQFNWNQTMIDSARSKSAQMLQSIVDKAHSFGIDITLTMLYAPAQIASEPVLCPSGIYYASTSLWGENDLDQWRSEVIGALGFSPNLRGLFDMAKYISNISRCSQVATIFVINSDTLKTHSNGSPINWAADWDFDYRYSKPYCTVERRGGAISDAAFKGVAMHELFHLFGAADEYDGSYDCSDQANCGLDKYGMLLATNNNCYLCAGGNQDPCVMNDPISEVSDICWDTRRALGWYDPDNNGGGLVDDMPVDHTALVTGNFNLGDYFEVRTLTGDFVNAFRIADYNSYLQPDGDRTDKFSA